MDFPALVDYFPIRIGTRTEHALHNLAPPGPYKSGEPEDLTLSDLKADVMEQAAPQIVDFQRHRSILQVVIIPRIEITQITANHHCNQFGRIRLGSFPGTYISTVPNNRHSVRDPEEFLHSVGDIDDAYILFLQPVDNLKQLLDFLIGKRGCRLVHHNDVTVK